MQVRMAPLEEVFLAVARNAELEHTQQTGSQTTLHIAEEDITLKVKQKGQHVSHKPPQFGFEAGE